MSIYARIARKSSCIGKSQSSCHASCYAGRYCYASHTYFDSDIYEAYCNCIQRIDNLDAIRKLTPIKNRLSAIAIMLETCHNGEAGRRNR